MITKGIGCSCLSSFDINSIDFGPPPNKILMIGILFCVFPFPKKE